ILVSPGPASAGPCLSGIRQTPGFTGASSSPAGALPSLTCPGWVKDGHDTVQLRYPLLLKKQTSGRWHNCLIYEYYRLGCEAHHAERRMPSLKVRDVLPLCEIEKKGGPRHEELESQRCDGTCSWRW